jgi:hypothetical protein
MESDKSITYLALSDSCPGQCGSRVTRRASFEDIEALASGLPMFFQRSYRIGSEQGVVVLKAALIDRRYRWVVTLEPLVTVGADDVFVVPRKVVEAHRPAGGSEERSPGLLIRRQ